MTALVRIHLGHCPGSGHASVNQGIAFKRLMRDAIGSQEGASLLSVQEGDKRGVEVVYDAEKPMAAEWACRAREAAGRVWEVVGNMGQRAMLR